MQTRIVVGDSYAGGHQRVPGGEGCHPLLKTVPILGVGRELRGEAAEEAEMKSDVLEGVLFGVTLGIGITILSLYTQKPGSFVSLTETIAERGRARRAKEEQEKLRRERLQSMGFSDNEIDEIF